MVKHWNNTSNDLVTLQISRGSSLKQKLARLGIPHCICIPMWRLFSDIQIKEIKITFETN